MTIVRTSYRYKRPPRKRKAVALDVPVIVSAKAPGKSVARPKSQRAETGILAAVQGAQPAAQTSTREEGLSSRTNDRMSAIVTVRRNQGRFGEPPDMTPEEHQRRGDAAQALWRELARRVRGQ